MIPAPADQTLQIERRETSASNCAVEACLVRDTSEQQQQQRTCKQVLADRGVCAMSYFFLKFFEFLSFLNLLD